ncbi:MAG TPA: glycoside hydrolase family 38 C-terminal domain-containing protein [Candidatus Acidoferrales bacterium]|nr:glycoside hydrolase family 38 C-terminal domain-containing protein [Candidatus Acidoferrales bacterium]
MSSLNAIPAGDWKFHVGDVAHGEATETDDSAWQTVTENSRAPTEAVWYRRWIEVPKTLNGYALSGARVWFQFEAYANGPMPQIIYFNGRRVAMGDDLEPIVLFDHAQPGERVLVAVKLLRTVDQKTFARADVAIEFSAARPNPNDLLQEILSANALLPALGPSIVAVRAAIEAASAAVDLQALQQAQQQAFDASLVRAEGELEKIRGDLQQTSIRLTGNSHIDAAWLWPWTETVQVVHNTFSTALQLMNEYPKYTFTQSAAAYSEWMCQKYPAICQEIQDRVKQGRWELVGGMWVEPDLNMPGGESLVRQLLIGKRYFREKFGADVRIGWNPDSFGYNWQLPQIYKKSGVDYFVTQKMAWNDTNPLPFKLFWWQSPDGSKVLSYFPHDYARGIEPEPLAEDVARARQLDPGLPEMMHLFGVGDHGGGPTRAMLDAGVRWTDPKMVYPKTFFGNAQGFFSDVEGKLDTAHSPVWNYKTIAGGSAQLPAPASGMVSLPTWNDELYFEYHRGVFTSQAAHKRNMRESEEWMLDAEKYSSLAWLFGLAYPAEALNEAWKKVLFNQFHDLAAGSGIGVIYQEAQRDYDMVRFTTGEASSAALAQIAARVDTLSPVRSRPVLVFNPLAWERQDLVEFSVQMPQSVKDGVSVLDGEHHWLPVQVISSDAATNTVHLLVEPRAVPALGYALLRVVPGRRDGPGDLSAHDFTLENSMLRVVVDPKNGCITSLYDKRAQFETIATGGCGNELIAFEDKPKDYDAWNIDADFEKSFTRLDMVDSVQLVERGPLRTTLRVTRTWQHSKFVQDITLYAGLDRVDVVNDFDWHETHVLLKAAFPLAASSEHATYEIPYGSIERPTTRNNSWEAAKFEVPALRWADLGDAAHGFSLINDSKYGYDAKGNVLRISLLRSPTWPDADSDRGQQHFAYALYPHAGDWKQALTVRRGYEFNAHLRALPVSPHLGAWGAELSFARVEQDNVVLTAVKKAEDGDALLFRFYEWAGKNGEVQLAVPAGAASATLTNLMEQAEGAPLEISRDGKVRVPVHPFEIVSVRVNYPRAGSGAAAAAAQMAH